MSKWIVSLPLAFAFLPVTVLHGQTAVNLKYQSRGVDFSEAPSTKVSRMGTDLPPSCAVGESFFKTDAPPGQNLFLCTAPGTWLPAAASASGDATSIQGSPISAETPVAAAQFHAWDAVAQEFALFTFGNLVSVTAKSINVATESVPQYAASASLPPSCDQYGLLYFDTDAASGYKLNYCNGATYETAGGAPAAAPYDPFDTTQKILVENWMTGSVSSGFIGNLSWGMVKVGGASGGVAFASPHGINIVATNAVNDYTLLVNPGSSNHRPFDLDATTWKVLHMVKVGSTTDAARFLLGSWDTQNVTISNGVYFEIPNISAANVWQACLAASGVAECVPLGVGASTSTWQALTIERSLSGTITFSVDGASKTFCASGCDGDLSQLPASDGYSGNIAIVGLNGTINTVLRLRKSVTRFVF